MQPSVAKIGGISVVRDIFAAANQASVAVVPHSAYFGPGLIATAHLSAALSRAPMIERLYCDLYGNPFGDWYEPVDGYLALPQGPGPWRRASAAWTNCASSETLIGWA